MIKEVIFLLITKFQVTDGDGNLKICSFNMEDFGMKEMNPFIRSMEIEKVINGHDLCLVHGIKDNSPDDVDTILNSVNWPPNRMYQMVTQSAVAHHESSSKHPPTTRDHFSFIYKYSSIKYDKDTGFIFDLETYIDLFEYPSFGAKFQSVQENEGQQFFLIGVHLKEGSCNETKRLSEFAQHVGMEVNRRFKANGIKTTEEILMMGNLDENVPENFGLVGVSEAGHDDDHSKMDRAWIFPGAKHLQSRITDQTILKPNKEFTNHIPLQFTISEWKTHRNDNNHPKQEHNH